MEIFGVMKITIGIIGRKEGNNMHNWGDGFPYFAEVEEAALEIGQFCKRYGRISVTQTKEKYGIARVYCHFGYHSLHGLLYPGWCFKRSFYPQWLWTFDIYYISKLLRFKPIGSIIYKWQKFIYRLAYKRALKKYPMIREEILDGADFTEFLKGL